MATTAQKTTPCCANGDSAPSRRGVVSAAAAGGDEVVQDWTVVSKDRIDDQRTKKVAMAPLIRPVDSLPEPSKAASTKGSLSLSLPLSVCLYDYLAPFWVWMMVMVRLGSSFRSFSLLSCISLRAGCEILELSNRSLSR